MPVQPVLNRAGEILSRAGSDFAQAINNAAAIKRNEERYLAQQERSDTQIEKSDIRYAAEIARNEKRYSERQQEELMVRLLSSIDKNSTINQINETRDIISSIPVETPFGKEMQDVVLNTVNSFENKIIVRNNTKNALIDLKKQLDSGLEDWNTEDANKALKILEENSDAVYDAGHIALAQNAKEGIKQVIDREKIVGYLLNADKDKILDKFDIKEGYTPNEVAYYEGMFNAANQGDWDTALGFAKKIPTARIEYEKEMRYQDNIAELTARKMLESIAKDKALIEMANYQAKEDAYITKIQQNSKQASQYSTTGKELALVDKGSDPSELQPIFATQIALVANEYGDAGSDWSVNKDLRKLVKKAFDSGSTDADKIAVAEWLVANPTEVDNMDFPGTGDENRKSRHSLELKALIKAYEGTIELLEHRGIKRTNERVGSINKQSPERKTPQSADDYFNLIGK